MLKSLQLAATAFLLLLSACATSPDRRLVAGAVMAPPSGFVDFCVRQREICGLKNKVKVDTPAADMLRRQANEKFWRAAFSEARSGRIAAANSPQTALANKPADNAESGHENMGGYADWSSVTLHLAGSNLAWNLLKSVNAAVNHFIVPREEPTGRGQMDHWSPPISDRGVAYGDCKQYVIEKRRRLVGAGIPSAALSIALADVSGENHAVLLVSTDDGVYVLDNLTDDIRRWEDVPYAWIERQRSDDPLDWASVRALSSSGG